MVKVVRIHKVGGPEVLTVEDIAVAAPGPGEVRLKHHAIGLNFIDTYFRTGLYPVANMPFVLGNEGAGEVIALGEGVTGLKKGDRVAYVSTHGGYSAERNIGQQHLVKLPAGISYEQGAGMMLKGLTAQYLLRRTFKVKPGHVILVHAAAGGTGQLLTQWGKHLGATVIGTVGSKEKAAIAKAHGCHHVILYREEDFVKRVGEITGGQKCDVVYDGVGKDTFMKSLDCLKPFGMMVSFGNASGPVDPVNLGLLGPKGSLYVARPTLFTHIAERKTLVAMARELTNVVASGAVKIPVTARFPLSNAADAHRALESRGTTGATVLIP
jgi:NADPH:quinone reductase